MRFELMVRPHQQSSQMSCWWTSMATVREYYGRRYNHFPWDAFDEFSPSTRSLRPYEPLNRYRYPDLSNRAANDPIFRMNPHELANSLETDPSQWYWHGLPGREADLRQLLDITHFRGIGSCPAPGAWTLRDIAEVLRRCGPYIFLGQWNGYPHAITVVGVDTGLGNVSYIDPAQGLIFNRNMASFNEVMGVRALSAMQNARLNPIYLPAPPQIRAIRWDEP